MIALLLIILLAQADDFVTFDVCYLDVNAHPWEFRPHPRGHILSIRPSAVLVVRSPAIRAGGIHCTRISATHGSSFVIGTPDQIQQALEAK